MKLYEITNEIEKIFEFVGEDGVISDEMLECIDNINQEFIDKAISVASYIKNLEAEQEAVTQAMAFMKARVMRLERQADYLRSYLQHNLEKMNINEIKKSPLFTIKIKQCPASVEIFEIEQIPDEYMNEKLVITPDKIKIKNDIKLGIVVPGATLQNKIKLEIK